MAYPKDFHHSAAGFAPCHAVAHLRADQGAGQRCMRGDAAQRDVGLILTRDFVSYLKVLVIRYLTQRPGNLGQR